MRSLEELFKELGFNPESSLEAQKAFVKNLIREAQTTQFQRKTRDQSLVGDQLSFDLTGERPAKPATGPKSRTG